MKCIYMTIPRDNRQVRVFIDRQWDELVARLYINGKVRPQADYRTPFYDHSATLDIADGIESANHMAGYRGKA